MRYTVALTTINGAEIFVDNVEEVIFQYDSYMFYSANNTLLAAIPHREVCYIVKG